MLALAAMTVFILALFGVAPEKISMLYLGLIFLSAHFALSGFWYGDLRARRSAP
jgi:hypothetical protein